MSWASETVKRLERKDKRYWTEDDYEAYYYSQECLAEDEADAEYLGCVEVIF